MTAVGVLILHPWSLTVIRFIVPMLTANSVWWVATDRVTWQQAVAVVLMLGMVVTVYRAKYGALHVQAAAYGHEQRFLLRPPVAVIPPLAMLWLLVATSAAVASHTTSTLVAAIACVCLAALTWFALHRAAVLARRWLVFVPAGIAIHDPLVLRDTFMVRSHDVRALRRASAGSEAFDATCTTWGDPIEIVLAHPHDVSLSQFGARISRTLDRLHVTALLVSPSQPTRVLARQQASPPPSTSRSSES